jgi:hypothetical protein
MSLAPPHTTKYDVTWWSDRATQAAASFNPTTPAQLLDEPWTHSLESIRLAQTAVDNATRLCEELDKQSPKPPEELLQLARAAVSSAQESFNQTQVVATDKARAILRTEEMQAYCSSAYDDTELLIYCFIHDGQPAKLAAWCAQSEHQEQLLVSLLDNHDLLATLIMHGRPSEGAYGRTLELLHELPVEQDPVLQRLRLAVALELCAPVYPMAVNVDGTIVPSDRYVHYQQAYLFGELDPAFSQFTVWELRKVVNSDATEHDLCWGRESLKNYRPDIAIADDSHWRYTDIVRTDVDYKYPDFYRPTRSYDQILAGGGQCGPRAWYGRFVTKAFGVPTWGCTQPGHAAMCKWTTQGWMTCLGAGFPYCMWMDRCGPDFLLETQARNACASDDEYMRRVMRLEMIEVFDRVQENSVAGNCRPDPKRPWTALGLFQRQILGATATNKLRYEPSGTSRVEELRLLESSTIRSIEKDASGAIIIPADATIQPTTDMPNVLFMKSFQGGRQVWMGPVAELGT